MPLLLYTGKAWCGTSHQASLFLMNQLLDLPRSLVRGLSRRVRGTNGTRRTQWSGLAVVLCCTLLIYGRTLSPTINSFDSAELVTGAYSLGIIHATGYPLYLLLAHLVTCLPWGSIPANVNFLSALFASLAGLFIYLTSYRLTKSAWIATFVALLLAFSRSFWSEAVLAEVYTLTAMLLSAFLYTSLVWLEERKPLALWLAYFLFGLNLTNHLGSLLYAPGLVLLLCAAKAGSAFGWRHLLPAGLCMAFPLSLYLYLPLRFASAPSLNYVGQYFDIDLTTLSGVLWMVSGRMFGPEMFGTPLREGIGNIAHSLYKLWLDLLGLGVVLALAGLRRLCRRIPFFLAFLLLGFVGTVLFFSFYDVVDADTMLLPALIALMPLVAVGSASFLDTLRALRWPKPFAWELGGALIATFVISLEVCANWDYTDLSADYSAYTFAEAIMAQVEPNAFIIAQWTSATPLEYMQIVEGRRPDVEIFDRGLYVLGVRDRLARQIHAKSPAMNDLIIDELVAKIERELQTRPVYIMESDPILRERFRLVALENGIYRVLPPR